MNVLDSIKSHAELEPGWYNGSGGPLSEAVIERALQLCYGISDAGYSLENLEDFPLYDGRLEIVCYSGIDYQFIISTDQLVRVSTIVQGKHTRLADRLTVTAAVELFKQREKWHLYASFTSGTLAANVGTLAGIVSSHLIPENYLLWTHNAYTEQPGAHAIMVEGFIHHQLQGIPSSFSNCNSPNFRPIQASNKKRRRAAISATTIYRGVTPKTPKLSEMRLQRNTWHEFASVKAEEIFPLHSTSSAESEKLTIGK